MLYFQSDNGLPLTITYKMVDSLEERLLAHDQSPEEELSQEIFSEIST